MIGRAYSIKLRVYAYSRRREGWKRNTKWCAGNGYHYGRLPPRYPVPAIIYDVYLPGRWDDQDCVNESSFGSIWERTRSDMPFNKRVQVLSPGE